MWCPPISPNPILPNLSNNFVPIRRNGITVRDRVGGRNGVRDRSRGMGFRDRVRDRV